jgi:hypothetical protein
VGAVGRDDHRADGSAARRGFGMKRFMRLVCSQHSVSWGHCHTPMPSPSPRKSGGCVSLCIKENDIVQQNENPVVINFKSVTE